MTRLVKIGAAQLGPIQRADSRASVVKRLLELMREAHAMACDVVVFPELALTTFFPRWYMADQAEVDSFFESQMPGPETRVLFDEAKRLGIGFYLGYAELIEEDGRTRHFNTSILVDKTGAIVAKYRKIHLPGSVEIKAGQKYQQLEKRYFAYGDLGFPAFRGPAAWGAPVLGMLICNDRRWPEGWRCYGLQGVELMVMGYNSAAYDPNGGEGESAELRTFHSTLAAQSNAYMNATWAVSVAKAGNEDGAGLIGGSVIIDPNGVIAAQAKTLGDEIILADADFDACRQGKEKMFNFEAHRRPQWYGRIVEQVGATPPA